MHKFAIFVSALTIAAVVGFSYEAMAGKKCPKGYTYSQESGKCVRKGGRGY